MKEIKIVLNNNQETFRHKQFSIFVDGTELQNIDKFKLSAKRIDRETLGNDFIDLDEIIKYSVDYYVPYFEDVKT